MVSILATCLLFTIFTARRWAIIIYRPTTGLILRQCLWFVIRFWRYIKLFVCIYVCTEHWQKVRYQLLTLGDLEWRLNGRFRSNIKSGIKFKCTCTNISSTMRSDARFLHHCWSSLLRFHCWHFALTYRCIRVLDGWELDEADEGVCGSSGDQGASAHVLDADGVSDRKASDGARVARLILVVNGRRWCGVVEVVPWVVACSDDSSVVPASRCRHHHLVVVVPLCVVIH